MGSASARTGLSAGKLIASTPAGIGTVTSFAITGASSVRIRVSITASGVAAGVPEKVSQAKPVATGAGAGSAWRSAASIFAAPWGATDTSRNTNQPGRAGAPRSAHTSASVSVGGGEAASASRNTAGPPDADSP